MPTITVYANEAGDWGTVNGAPGSWSGTSVVAGGTVRVGAPGGKGGTYIGGWTWIATSLGDGTLGGAVVTSASFFTTGRTNMQLTVPLYPFSSQPSWAVGQDPPAQGATLGSVTDNTGLQSLSVTALVQSWLSNPGTAYGIAGLHRATTNQIQLDSFGGSYITLTYELRTQTHQMMI